MALVYRGGRPYLYKSVRRGGRVTSEYVAGGEAAVLIDRMEAIDREERDLRRREEAERREGSEELERGLDELCREAAEAAAAELEAAGYRRHNRSEWRRRRGG